MACARSATWPDGPASRSPPSPVRCATLDRQRQTLVRVQEAASRADYTPSQLGRQLAERRHAANGIVFPDLSGPYYAEVVLGYEAVASELGRAVLILSTHGRPAAAEMVDRLAGRCDGLVVLGPTVPDEVLVSVADRGVPLVLAARAPVGRHRLGVRGERRSTARALATHLADDGCPVRRLRRRSRSRPTSRSGSPGSTPAPTRPGWTSGPPVAEHGRGGRRPRRPTAWPRPG